MPDDELLRLASQGALRRPDVLESQVKRMLRDRRSRALAEQFASQWLQTRKLSTFTPDPKLFPEFDSSLKRAMLEEAELFFASILEEDRSVLDFLEADYTFVNERLARHYGIKGVDGEAFQRVSLEGTSRGGVITMASVLTATSNPTRTSPVKRGRWILENILGAPPAPPPAGVEALKEDAGTRWHAHAATADGATPEQPRMRLLSPPDGPSGICARELRRAGGLARPGALGSPSKRTVDCRGAGPSAGQRGSGRPSCRAEMPSLAASPRKCSRTQSAEDVDQADKPAVEEIVRRLARNNYRFSELVLGIALSEPFQKRESARRDHETQPQNLAPNGLEGPGCVAGIAAARRDGRTERSAAKQVPARSRPLRMAFLYVPNGVHMPDWTPTAEGKDSICRRSSSRSTSSRTTFSSSAG